MTTLDVLLVEDDVDVRETTQLVLERHGFRVHTAIDGPAGLSALHRNVPDVAVSPSTWQTPRPRILPTIAVPWWASLRFRLTIVMATLSPLIIMIFGSFAVHTTAVIARQQLRSQAIAELTAAVAASTFGSTPPVGVTIDSSTLPPGLKAAARIDSITTYYDGNRMWSIQLDRGHTVSLALDDTSMREQSASLIGSMLGSALALIALASVAGWIASGQLTHRLRETAQAARLIGGGDLSHPVEAHGRDEVAVLAQSIEQMATSLTQWIEKERTQIADAAHELKTPLTALVSSAERLDDSRAAVLVRSQVQRIRKLVETTLELERLSMITPQPLNADHTPRDLGAAVSRFVSALPSDLACELIITSSHLIVFEERSLVRVPTNLVANAHKHGGTPVWVGVGGAAVMVGDSGPEFPDQILKNGPRRFQASGAEAGSGLGLVIASVYAQSIAATLTLSNSPCGGSVSTVTFADADAAR